MQTSKLVQIVLNFVQTQTEFGNIFNIIVLVMGILMLILNFGYLFYNRD